MTSLISGAEPGFEPIEGYVLRERIGAGGYGEVWLADAPGGLQKAIKFVFGSIDERAGNELRALQRIRAVHHPFILSLERIEVVNNQLIVVTELADSSLLDRFREFHSRGLVGIPRNRLLEYLRDTADALDFLCQKHDLQHLDVKPANLLLVADRVKVADFGLIKDLQNKSMSVMSGMTPTYAAPEMFDGRPGRFSDQYSLAIVYQELLTGTLPFNGRTTAQLATEHLHKAPQLDPLPISDRPVVAKALAKKPSQRFSSCKEFVEQLYRTETQTEAKQADTTSRNQARAANPSTRLTPRSAHSTPKMDGKYTVPLIGKSTGTHKRDIVELPSIDIPETLSTALAPSLIIGLGGTGAEVLTSLRSRLQASGLDLQTLTDLAWILADTNEATLQQATDPATVGRLTHDEILFLPLRTAQQYRQRSQDAFTPLSRRWLYNVPRSRETEGVRPMGMLAFLDYAHLCYDSLHNAVESLVKQFDPSNESKPIRIYLVGSAHGGTGSVLAIEFAFMIRNILAELDQKANVQLMLSVGDQSGYASTELATAAAVACLQEIAHFERTNGLHPGVPGLPDIHSSMPPWQQVYLVHGGVLGKSDAWRSAIEQLTDFLCIDACTAVGELLDVCRDQTRRAANVSEDSEWQPWLRMFASRPLELSDQLHPDQLSKRITLHALQDWLAALNANSNTTDPTANEEALTSTTRNHAATQQMEYLVGDLFREQKWSAQSWVRQCMDRLFPLPDRGTKTSVDETISKHPLGLIDDWDNLEQLGLDRLTQSFGVALSQSQFAARAMLDDAILGLITWLKSRWLQTHDGWSQLEELLRCIRTRFTSQSQSLQKVADRLTKQRETTLQAFHDAHSGENASEPAIELQQEMKQQIRSLEVQASVHHIASRMLDRIGESVEHLAQVWRIESRMASEEFLIWAHRLASELNMKIDADGRVRDTWQPIPANWFGVREATEKGIEQAIRSLIHQRFFASLLPSEEDNKRTEKEAGPANTAPTEYRRFDDRCLERLLELGNRDAEQAAIEAGLVEGANSGDAKDDRHATDSPDRMIQLDPRLLTDHLRVEDLVLLSNGGAKRTLLLLPSDACSPESMEAWKKTLKQSVTVVALDGLRSGIVCVDGEQIDLAQLVYRLWLPSHERCQLADRLHSRDDIEWLPVE